MKNKYFLILLSLVFLFALTNFVLAKDVAYVVKTAQNPKIISVLNDMNYTYDVILESNIAKANFSNYAVLLIQDSISNKNAIPLNSKNLVFIDKDYAPLVWNSGTLVVGSSNIFSAKLERLGSVFTTGLDSITFDAYTTPKPEYFLKVYPAGITAVARTTGSTGSYPIIAYSDANNLRRVFFGFYSIDYWSADTEKLFKNSLNWTRLGVDGDKDGYYSDNDCNDSDSGKWRLIPGYLDKDKDGKGTGSILQVCSGENLPIGYSNISGDCNDSDSGKWRLIPGYLDKDKDRLGAPGILQVCSGENLSSGYSSIGGDCDDNDESKFQYLNAYLDSDKDGRGAGEIVKACSGENLSGGYSNFGNDCNDSDNSSFRIILGYLDSDGDSFGSGEQLEVCSGLDLHSGYSLISRDCNDNNLSINPNATEIPLDGIDQKCSGYDLADVDGDGYCKAGYSIINSIQCSEETGNVGSDCNDSDISVYPASSDLSKDCKNDAPLVSDINNIRIRETEKVVINVSASDPENDELIYSINDTRFEQNSSFPNIFSWHTDYSDSGNYSLQIVVSDGILNTSKEFNLEIIKTNRAPSCKEVPLIMLNEEETMTLDLNDYCSDIDSDQLIFNLKQANSNLTINQNNSEFTFIGKKDYSGNESILFNVSDGIDSVELSVDFEIIGINDAPLLVKDIEDVILDEETNISDKFDLKNYFSDIDSQLIFNVTGNNFVNITINNGKVSFYPNPGFFGRESVVFSAKDEEFTIYSNPVLINVNDINAAPVFNELNCSLNISEDSEYGCELIASDFENDSFSFSVVNSSNMNCTIQGNLLKYISNRDFVGTGFCNIRVSDIRGASNEKIINFIIANVNDAPSIKDFYPKETSVKVLQNVDKRFLVLGYDNDSSFNIVWKINDDVVGNSSSYYFNKSSGNYNLTAIVSDGEYSVNKTWNIYSGNVSEFKCSELNGHICNENQTCNGQLLGVSDSNYCCDILCSAKPLEFKNIKNITNGIKNDNILISIEDFSDSDLYLGEEFNFSVIVKNNYTKEIDSDVYVYIYDISKQRTVEKSDKSIKIYSNSQKDLDFSFTLDKDIKENNDYYIFIRVIGKDDNGTRHYNQMYKKLNIDRQSSDLNIKSVEFEPGEGFVCGDEINAVVNVENLGKYSQLTSFRVESSKLEISMLSDSFRVNEYDNGDSKQTILLQIPAEAKEGIYTLKFSLIDSNEIFEKELEIGACKNQLNVQTSLDTIKINAPNKEIVSLTESDDGDNALFIVVGVISVLTMSVILFILIFYIQNLHFTPKSVSNFNKNSNSIIKDENDKIFVDSKTQRIFVRTKKK